jgi:transcriptional regulator GlxA family with amidase domain
LQLKSSNETRRVSRSPVLLPSPSCGEGTRSASARHARQADSLDVVRLLESAASENPDSTLAELCGRVGISYRRMLRACIKHRGIKPTEWLRHQRLNAAREELVAGRGSVKEVAWRHGFGRDIGRFAGYYRRVFNELPSETLRSGRATAAPCATAHVAHETIR